MINNDVKSSLNNFFNESNSFTDHPSIISNDISNLYYLNMINKTLPNFTIDENRLINHNKKIFFNSNIPQNHYKNFSYWNNVLSDLSFNKYRKMIIKDENNDFNKTRKSHDFFKENKININYTNPRSINKNYRKLNKDIRKNSDVEKYRKLLNKEILNYNLLEKKINRTIERSNISKRISINDNENDIIITNNEINKHNKKDIKNDNEILNRNIKLSKQKDQDKKYKNLKNNKEKNIRRNPTFNKNFESKENLNQNFIKYLKKDNQKLYNINAIYKQLLDSFFYFINQLSKKYQFEKEIKDINYYTNNTKHLSNILIDLEEHLNKLIKEKNEDIEHELKSDSKFIKINVNRNIKNKAANKTNSRNYISLMDYISQNQRSYKNNYINKNIINKTEYNISKDENINDEIEKKKNNPFIKNKKIIKIMNKLNLEFLNSPKQANLNNKLILSKKRIINNNKNNKNIIKNSKINESNDLKSLINPKFYKD